MPDHYEHSPFPGVPKFFRRDYDQRGAEVLTQAHGVTMYNLTAGERLTIYGYSIRSPYPEDHAVEERSYKHLRTFFSMCFSVKVPDGEVGFTPLDEVQEISQAEFERALSRLQGATE